MKQSSQEYKGIEPGHEVIPARYKCLRSQIVEGLRGILGSLPSASTSSATHCFRCTKGRDQSLPVSKWISCCTFSETREITVAYKRHDGESADALKKKHKLSRLAYSVFENII